MGEWCDPPECPWCGSDTEARESKPEGNWACPECGAHLYTMGALDKPVTVKPPEGAPDRVMGVPE